MPFVVEIPQYGGPLDLLLHIVRREEISLSELPLADVTAQYLSYLDVLVELEIDDVAEFLEIASLLVEMKSKQALPSNDSDAGGDAEENGTLSPHPEHLVQRLMEYKRIRDAASILEEHGHRWQMRYARQVNDLPGRRLAVWERPIRPIEVWDLVSAFGRILRERRPPATENVVQDDTPIHVYMDRIHEVVRREKRVELTSLFEPHMHKSVLVAMFLATLELTRHHGLQTDQRQPGQPLYLVAGENFDGEKPEGASAEQANIQGDVSSLPLPPR